MNPANWLYGIHVSDAVDLLGHLSEHHDKLLNILASDQELQKQTRTELRTLLDGIGKDFYLLKEAIKTAPRFKQIAPSGICEPLN